MLTKADCTGVLRVLMPNPDGSIRNPCLARIGLQDITFDPVALLQVVEARLNPCLSLTSRRPTFKSLGMNYHNFVEREGAERNLLYTYGEILEEQLSKYEDDGFVLDYDAE